MLGVDIGAFFVLLLFSLVVSAFNNLILADIDHEQGAEFLGTKRCIFFQQRSLTLWSGCHP
jgi:hypothetical protein